MGNTTTVPIPPGTFSALAEGEKPGAYAIRRHPHYAKEVFGLPKEFPNGQALYLDSMQKHGDNEYIGNRKIVNGKRSTEWEFIKYKDAYKMSENFGSGLVSYGVVNETKVCVYSENRTEWILTMDASYLYGFVTVSLYDTFSPDALEFSIQNCQAKYICVSRKNLSRLMQCSDEILKQFKLIVAFDPIETEEEKVTAKRLESLGVALSTFTAIMEIGSNKPYPKAAIDPEQLLYICYSSGTTGFPKGVMISHRCFITNLFGIFLEGDKDTFIRHLCYLPLCHVFERMCTSCTMFAGGRIGIFSGQVNLLTEDMQTLRPTVFIVVPRVIQRINDTVKATLSKSSVVVRTVFNVGWYIKRFMLRNELPTGLLDRFIFNKVKNNLGGCVQQIVSGGAALPADLHETMQVILGIPIRTGYGLSEGGSGNTLNPYRLVHIKYGTNGYPLRNVEIKIVPTEGFEEPGVGEIQMGGTGLCSGYLNDPEATAALFTDETHKWIRTGDIGKWDEDGSLLVVDRMRSIFKLSQGEYVAGDLLAQYFESSDLIESIFVYGDASRQYLIGIVIPALHAARKVFGKPNMTREELAENAQNPRLEKAVMEELNRIATEKKLLGYQKVRAIRCVVDEWTVENGVLSPTFKVKRKVLASRYSKEIEELYAAQ